MTAQEFDREVQQVIASGALGRAAAYSNLLQYLRACSISGKVPKELDIAVEVFGRDDSFDPSQDSMVRVYVHNLRQKLDAYYEKNGGTDGVRLEIPRGQYRLVLLRQDTTATGVANGHDTSDRPWILVAAVAVAGVAIGWWLSTMTEPGSGRSEFADAPVWREVLDDSLPVTVVVGDYFMFAELDDSGMPSRLIREFQVNSSADLRRMLRGNPELSGQYGDLDLTYLPIGSGPALVDLMRVFADSERPVVVTPASKFQADALRSSHVIYVGYLSGLGQLAQFVFTGSGIAVGTSYDELIVIDTGDIYVSEAGLAADGETNYVDYGYVSAFAGPAESRVVIVAGTRDEGLMQAARYLTTGRGIDDLASVTSGDSIEVLLEVTGFDRTNLDANRVYHGPIRVDDVWSGR